MAIQKLLVPLTLLELAWKSSSVLEHHCRYKQLSSKRYDSWSFFPELNALSFLRQFEGESYCELLFSARELHYKERFIVAGDNLSCYSSSLRTVLPLTEEVPAVCGKS